MGAIRAQQTAMCLNAHGQRIDMESENFIAHTLKGEGFDASEDGTGRGTPLVAATLRSGGDNPASHKKVSGLDDNLIAFHGGSFPSSAEDAQGQAVGSKYGVRRLMPVETEILQGYPRDWTRYAIGESTGEVYEQADSPRYKQCGNGVTAAVAEWIGHRISLFLSQKVCEK